MRRRDALFAVALAALAAAGCDRGRGAGAGAPPRPAARKFPVETATARPEPIRYRIESIGEIEAEEWVRVSAEVEGVLGPLHFREGDRVDPARVLVEVDPERYRLALAQREAALAKAKADLAEKDAALKKRLELRTREEGWVPEEEITQYRSQVAQARAAVGEAQALRDIAARDVERARVRAPIEGVIERRAVSVGQYVKPGDQIASIVRTKPVRVRFSVREEEAQKVFVGTPITFSLPAIPGETFAGEVFFVARSADPKTRRIDVLARNANEDERLKPGYFARVAIEVGARGDAIMLPESAVLATEDGFVAYVVEGGRAKKRLLEIGLQTPDGRIEVKRGIVPGEEVVVRGAGNLLDGAEVVVRTSSAPAAKDGQPPARPGAAGAGGSGGAAQAR